MYARAFLKAGVFLALAQTLACKEDAPAPLPLDAQLHPGEVRAGRIQRSSELLSGLTARGRTGDFKLYNDQVAFVISEPGHATGFHPFGGTVLDAAPIDAGSSFGEIIIGFDRSVQRPDTVTIVKDGSDGKEARIRVSGVSGVTGALPLLTAILGALLPEHALTWTVDYILRPDASYLEVEHRLENLGSTNLEIGLPFAGFFFGTGATPFIEGTGYGSSNTGEASEYYGASGPRASYLFYRGLDPITVIFGESGIIMSTVGDPFTLRPRESRTITDRLVIGHDMSEAQVRRHQLLTGEQAKTVSGSVVDTNGAPVPNATVHLVEGDAYRSRAEVDPTGHFVLYLPDGASDSQVVATSPDRRRSESTVMPQTVLTLPATGRLRYHLVAEDGAPVPVKLSIHATTSPAPIPRSFGLPAPSTAVDHVVYSETGTGWIDLPAGDLEITASRGSRYEIVQGTRTLTAGAEATFEGTMVRSVDTSGWLAADTHLHAQWSSDSRDLYPDKVRALAAEEVELPVSTEHEAVGDFNPAIQSLGLSNALFGLVGTEISTLRFGHINAFPIDFRPDLPGNGRLTAWYTEKPRGIFENARLAGSHPFIQINHPRSKTVGYFEITRFDRTIAKGNDNWSDAFDGMEVINGCGDGALDREEVQDWFALLSSGRRVWATGSTDDHNLYAGELGYPVTFVRMPSSVRETTAEQFSDGFHRGALVVSCGPFLEMQIQNAEAGGMLTKPGAEVSVAYRVGAPSWMDVDEVLTIVNGQVQKALPLERTDGPMNLQGTVTATVPTDRDSWVILWARGDQPHGVWASSRPSFAFTNPIFVDANGDGIFAP